MLMIRHLLSVFCASFLFGFAGPLASAATQVTEGDLQMYRDLEYATRLFEVRKMWARRDAGKIGAAQAELDAAWRESGWTRERFDEVYDAVGQVLSNIRAARSGDISEDDLKSALAEQHPTTVAAVRARFDELEAADDSGRAEKQVRDEIARERAGAPPTPAQLQGTWVYDIDATVEAMGLAGLFGGAELAKLKADTLEKSGNPSYTFGPGDAMESRVKAAGGTERIDKGFFRIEGDKIYMRAADSKREHEMQIGIRQGRLVMGTGTISAVFIKQ
jgi:hypothetical protein